VADLTAMRTMIDSVTARDIPASAAMVAGYVDGLYRWTAADWARFPAARKVRIAVFATTNDGQVLDIETGAATPAQAAGWVRMRLAAGQYPSVYVNRANVGAVLAALHAAGLDGKFGVWLADWTGVPHLAPGTYATQYAGSAQAGGHFDLSLVSDFWPGIDPSPPPPTPAPSPGPGGGAGDQGQPWWVTWVRWLARWLGLG
jgi:hypothetical protein